jgi:predicted DNA-binding transcriptional regulator AlpA
MTNDTTTAGNAICLNLKEVAALAGMKVRTIRRWVRDGKFVPPRRGPGGRLVFLRPEVEAYLAALPIAADAPLLTGFAAEK